MPVYEVELSDGRKFEVEADAPPSEADVMSALGDSTGPAAPRTPDQEPEGSGGASAFLGALRAAPAVGRSIAGAIARHPSATQKAISAGVTGTAASVGGVIGGVPGAIAGGAIRGATPMQSTIREVAGRMSGEAPTVAKNAGRAVAVSEYAKPLGLTVKPTDLVSTGNAARALDNYADSGGLKVPRVLDQFGKVVYGPESPPKPKAPSRIGGAASKAASGIGRILSPLSAMTGATDFAQTVEPNRRDIGVMGIGRSQPTPQGAELDAINQRNIAAMQARQAEQAQQQHDIKQWILSRLGF